MAFPYIPVGISAGVLGLLLLWGRDANAAPDGGVPIPPPSPTPPNRTWPAGTPVAVVAVDPSDPGLQGRQPGVRLRSEPTTKGGDRTITNAGVPNGQLLAVLSGEIADEQGRKWRRVATLQGQTGYAPFVGPDGKENMKSSPQYPAAWPTGDVPAPTPVVAGLPPSIGAAPLGWTAWNSGYARNGQSYARMAGLPPHFAQMGATAPISGPFAQCVRGCQLYQRMDRGPGFTVVRQIPAGAVLRVAPNAPGLPGLAGPTLGGRRFVLASFGDTQGWVDPAALIAFTPTAPVQNTLGRRRVPYAPYAARLPASASSPIVLR